MKKTTLVLSSTDIIIPNGTHLDICSIDGETAHTMRVVSRSGTVLTIAELRWWQKLWLWVQSIVKKIKQ